MIHATLDAVRPISDALWRLESGIEVCNFANEALLAHANRCNGVDAWGVRSFFQTAMLAIQSQLDGIMIACTLYCDRESQLQEYTDVPVIAVDRPMIQQAVAGGRKVGVLATTAASGPAALGKLRLEALRQGRPLQAEMKIVTEAMTVLKQGDGAAHDQMLYQAARQLVSEDCGTILLSQITMARAASTMTDLDAEVLTSPATGAAEMIQRIRGERT